MEHYVFSLLMRILYLIIAVCLLSCGDRSNNFDPDGTTLRINESYEVIISRDIIYAQGLSHESFTSSTATVEDLLLDAFIPNNAATSRPAMMLIHGGGFLGGSKEHDGIVDMAGYFASRGWVVFSINYRLRNDAGTIPVEWFEAFEESEEFSEDEKTQFYAMYPAHRDAKAALRWIIANKDMYNIDEELITVGGGSAGAITAIGLGISEPEDFRDEISLDIDPTLASTNLNVSYDIKTILDFWGSDTSLDALELIFGQSRFDESDPPMLIVHGTEDTTVLYSEAEDLVSSYESYNIPFAFFPKEGAGHGLWTANFDGKSLSEIAFDFIVSTQNLEVD